MYKDVFNGMQLFAEEGATDQGADCAGASAAEDQEGAQGNQEGNKAEEGKPEPEKKYTDADVDRIIARKIAAERQRMQKLFNDEQQESELEVRERNVLKRELIADAKDALLDAGLPSSLANVMNYSSKEEYEKSFKEVTDIFRDAMAAEYKRRLSGPAPRVSTGSGDDRAIAEAFAPRARY